MDELLINQSFNIPSREKFDNFLNKKRQQTNSYNNCNSSTKTKFIVIKNANNSSNNNPNKIDKQKINNNNKIIKCEINNNKRKIFSTKINPYLNSGNFTDINKQSIDLNIKNSISNNSKDNNVYQMNNLFLNEQANIISNNYYGKEKILKNIHINNNINENNTNNININNNINENSINNNNINNDNINNDNLNNNIRNNYIIHINSNDNTISNNNINDNTVNNNNITNNFNLNIITNQNQIKSNNQLINSSPLNYKNYQSNGNNIFGIQANLNNNQLNNLEMINNSNYTTNILTNVQKISNSLINNQYFSILPREDVFYNNNNFRLYTLQKEFKTFGEFLFFKEEKIGSGSFGEVIYGMNKNQNIEVAVKLVTSDTTTKAIKKEIYFTKLLEKEIGFPRLYDSGIFETKKIIIESLLGPSLDKLFKYCQKSFPIKTVCRLGKEIINRLQSMHKKGLIHRDLKPNNLTWGNFSSKYNNNKYNPRKFILDNDITTIYLIDFGLSCSYIGSNNGKHYKYEEGYNFVGTLRYASINSHKGIRQSRRDDLESMMYILIYFLKGKLPWQDIKAKQKQERQEKILEKKQKTTINELCQNLPKQFNNLLEYSKKLGFEQNPDYNKYDYMFQNIIDNIKENENLEKNYYYIWEKKLVDDLITANGNEMDLSEDTNMVFKGYPIKMKKYIEFIMSERSSNNNDIKDKSQSTSTYITCDNCSNKTQ